MYTAAGLNPQDLAWCAALLPRVSRTFALSIAALPGELRLAVQTAYLLCRVVDSIEDAADLPAAQRQLLFEAFDATLGQDSGDVRALEELSAGLLRNVAEAEQELCCEAGAVFRVFRALPPAQRAVIRPHVREMSRGMKRYVFRGGPAGRIQITDMGDLERYCYFVAGTVGQLLTELFLQHVQGVRPHVAQRLRRLAVGFGLGLQMVNIVKDTATDHSRGSCFLPRRLAETCGLDLAHVLDPGQRGAALAVVQRICARTRRHLRAAQRYTLLWPLPQGEPVRLFCAVPLALALTTLAEVERGVATVQPGQTPKVSRQVVFRLLEDARLAVGSNGSLDRMLSRYGEPAA